MRNCWRHMVSVLIVMICWTASAGAETRYISDQLVVSLREQPRPGAQSITHLKTDMAVEILEESGEYIKVQTEAGEIGYIKQHYLTATTPKPAIIKQLQRERDRLADKASGMQQQLAATSSQSDKSQKELATQLAENQKQINELQEKLEASQAILTRTSQDYQTLQKDAKAVVEITQERNQLRETNQELTTTITDLKDKVEDLTITGIIKWFLAGAGVLVLGWMIGKFSGSRRRARF